MNYQHSFAISAAGMDVERMRVEVASLNLANAHTVAARESDGYKPLQVVARAMPGSAAAAGGLFTSLVDSALAGPVATVETSLRAPRRVLEPGHPQADAQGFVNYPGVDPVTEMMTLLSATRAYEANVVAMNSARTMTLKALEIGGNT
jgi:flagellar basal-body rod protein FlgC